MLLINDSFDEGGGQILRTSLALSAEVTGNMLGSLTLTSMPQKVLPGTYHVAIAIAGSGILVL